MDGIKLKPLKRLISLCIVVAVLVTLFIFSGQNASESSNVSQGISDIVIEFLRSLFPALELNWVHHFIRKMAHFTLFAILGVGLCGSVEGIIEKKFMCILLIGFLVACLDEMHQIFSAGRSASFGDVLLDESGVIAGYFLYKICK